MAFTVDDLRKRLVWRSRVTNGFPRICPTGVNRSVVKWIVPGCSALKVDLYLGLIRHTVKTGTSNTKSGLAKAQEIAASMISRHGHVIWTVQVAFIWSTVLFVRNYHEGNVQGGV